MRPSPSSTALRLVLRPVLGLAVVGGSLVVHSSPLSAQASGSSCAAAEFHQFDFWIGRWTVANTAGQQVGTSEVQSVAGGCGLLENWTAGNGGSGKSLNMYEPGPGHWTQTWVGSGGAVLRMAGGITDGRMSMSGEAWTPRGRTHQRITWTPMDDGRVRQTGELSTDGGATWQTSYDFYYSRTSG